jgi:hypothetical protein
MLLSYHYKFSFFNLLFSIHVLIRIKTNSIQAIMHLDLSDKIFAILFKRKKKLLPTVLIGSKFLFYT